MNQDLEAAERRSNGTLPAIGIPEEPFVFRHKLGNRGGTIPQESKALSPGLNWADDKAEEVMLNERASQCKARQKS